MPAGGRKSGRKGDRRGLSFEVLIHYKFSDYLPNFVNVYWFPEGFVISEMKATTEGAIVLWQQHIYICITHQ